MFVSSIERAFIRDVLKYLKTLNYVFLEGEITRNFSLILLQYFLITNNLILIFFAE